MNVAIFTDNDFGKVNGVTTALRAVLAHAPGDVRARVYTEADRASETSDYLALRAPGIGIPFYSEMSMYWPRFGALLRHASADHIDVVHLTTPGPLGLAAMFVARRLGVPMVGSFHTQLAEYTATLSGSPRLGALMREYMRWPYGRCRRILAPSEATRAQLVAAKIDPAKIAVWTRGVDGERFAPARRSAALRESWRLGPDQPALLYAGRLSKEKGLDRLTSVARCLADRQVRPKWIFVGRGPLEGALRQQFPEAVFAGAVPHDDVGRWMASADVFVFPSRTDTAGNVVLEAQASGLPVVVSDEGGPKENMRTGVTGYATGLASGIALETAVAFLAQRESRRRRMGEAARAYALERTWARSLAPLFDAWRAVAERESTARVHDRMEARA